MQRGIEDVAFIQLRYPSGCLAHIHASWLNPNKVRQITVVGSQRMLTWDDMDASSPVTIYDRGAVAANSTDISAGSPKVQTWNLEVCRPKIAAAEPLRVQNTAFLEAMRSGEAVRSDGRFALGVVHALQAVNESPALGGVPIRLDDSIAADVAPGRYSRGATDRVSARNTERETYGVGQERRK